MTELTPYQADNRAQHAPAAPSTTGALIEWANSASAVHQVAEQLVRTSFVPEAFRNKPHEATAAILAGLEVGLSPMAALRSFDVIQGTAAPRAFTLRAIVQAAGHSMWIEESTKTRAIVCGRRRGQAEIHRSIWTTERARDLGLLGKHNWKGQPGAMLVARATSECARLVAADAILGIGYTAEELADDIDADEPKPKRTKRTARRAATPEPELEPEQPQPEPDTARADRPGPEPATAEQLRKIHAAFNELVITDRDEKIEYARRVVQRDIESSHDLNIREASALIDTLESDIQRARETETENNFAPEEPTP